MQSEREQTLVRQIRCAKLALYPGPYTRFLKRRNTGLVSTGLRMCQFKTNEYSQTTLLRRGAPARDVLRMNIPIKFTTSWQSGMQ